jgi:lipid II:glycine glycyltransferase (peptidoglycan interpeptide bridge formation enzyme)
LTTNNINPMKKLNTSEYITKLESRLNELENEDTKMVIKELIETMKKSEKKEELLNMIASIVYGALITLLVINHSLFK